jgi:hypothetical protein
VILSDAAPGDILTRNAPWIDDPLDATGIPIAGLSGAASDTADELLDLYLDRFPQGSRMPDRRDVRFAWAGAHEPGVGHYYRFAGPRLLVELDNTQSGANHVHTVVRDPVADFGDDLLASHYRHAHH